MRPAAIRNVAAPAKLNLFLHVTGRRADGYHLLETVFRLIDLSDRMDFGLRDDGAITLACNPRRLGGADNLALRAARLLREAAGIALGAHIDLDKHIPAGGGLGGGSSDAATTLLALNRLWGLRWSATRLAALGLRLGADVPMFVHGRNAYARGVGERLLPLVLPARWYVLVAPPVEVSTALAFAAPELTRDTKPIRIAGFSRKVDGLAGRNDLQPVVVRRFPAVARSLEVLSDAARGFGEHRSVRMTGSGACSFCECRSAETARAIAVRVRAAGVGRVHVCRGLDQNPLTRWATGP